MTYKYIDPVKDLGMRKINIPIILLNILYPQEFYRSFIYKYEFYINNDETMIYAHKYYRTYIGYLSILSIPIMLLMHGFGNYKQVLKDSISILKQNEYGSFIKHEFHKHHNNRGYDAIISYINSHAN